MTSVGIESFSGVSPSVYEPDGDPVVVADTQIEALVAAARQAPDGRARLLLHPQRSDPLHEMIIVLPPDSCDHPHINFRSGKSFLALSGQFAVMCFSDDGREVRPVVLSADGRQRGARMLRLQRPTWHTIIPISGDTVFLETNMGPFTGNRFAEWFPGKDDPAALQAVRQQLRERARAAAAALG